MFLFVSYLYISSKVALSCLVTIILVQAPAMKLDASVSIKPRKLSGDYVAVVAPMGWFVTMERQSQQGNSTH